MTSTDSKIPDDDVRDVAKLTNSDRLRVTLELVVAALILAAIYYIFAPQDDIDLPPPLEKSQIDPIIRAEIDAASNQTAPTEKSVVAKEEVARLDSPSQLKQRTKPAEPVDNAVSEGGSARALIARLRAGETAWNPDQILNQVTTYQNEGKSTDAYLLLFYAAREGDASAAFSLASMHDPNHFTKGNPLLDKPDAYQAHKWYSAAAGKGISKANERLRRLRQTTEKQAKKGDPAAKRLLLNWQ
jgi:TPR repeat protein